MILRDVLRAMDPDDRIRIGTTDGVGFIYFGTAGRLRTEYGLKMANSVVLKSLKEAITIRVNGFGRNVKDPKAFREKAVKMIDDLAEWEPVEDREVTDSYMSTVNKDEYILIVTGTEGFLDAAKII